MPWSQTADWPIRSCHEPIVQNRRLSAVARRHFTFFYILMTVYSFYELPRTAHLCERYQGFQHSSSAMTQVPSIVWSVNSSIKDCTNHLRKHVDTNGNAKEVQPLDVTSKTLNSRSVVSRFGRKTATKEDHATCCAQRSGRPLLPQAQQR